MESGWWRLFTCLSPRHTGTGSGGRVTDGLATRRLGQDWDSWDWNVTLKSRDGEMKLSKACIETIKV
jgi:hypothetical protein